MLNNYHLKLKKLTDCKEEVVRICISPTLLQKESVQGIRYGG